MLTENMNHVPFKTVVYPQLKAALQGSGITPPELSEKIGVSPLCLWRWTTGKNEFSIRVIKALYRLGLQLFRLSLCAGAHCLGQVQRGQFLQRLRDRGHKLP